MACLKGSELWNETNKVEAKWAASKTLEKWGYTNDVSAFKTLFEASTGKLFETGENITPKDMKKMNVAIDRLEKDLRSPGILSNKVLRHFYVGSAKAMRNPLTNELYNELVNANEYRNSHTTAMKTSYKNMLTGLKEAMLESTDTPNSSYIEQYKAGKITKDLFEKLNKKERTHVLNLKNNKDIGFDQEIGQLWRFLEGEGVVFQDLMDLITGDRSILEQKYRGQGKNKYIDKLGNAADAWNEVQQYAQKHLVRSISDLSDIINLKYGEKSRTAEFLTNEYKEIAKQLEKYEGGYVPHYVLDLLGQSMEIREKMGKTKTDTERDNVLKDYLAKTKEINTSLINRLKPRKGDPVEYFSRNPMLYATKYIEQVIQFNHSTHVDKAYTKGLKQITEVILRNPDSKEADAARVYKSILTDLHASATGNNKVQDSPTLSNVTRLITSLQFTAKLGFSTRGALRNATQRFLNFSYFGPRKQRDAIKAYQGDTRYKDAMQNELNRHGLRFVDIAQVTEGAVTAHDLIAHGIDYENGILTYRDTQTILEKATVGAAKLSDFSSGLTKWAENKNRSSTFKVAFHTRAEQLKNLEQYTNLRNNPKLEAELHRKAGNYAAKVTSLLHFEYSPFGKASIMQSKPGAILGQFQHYAFSFANLQAQMFKDYSRAMKAGDYFGPEAGRIVRLASIYAMAEAISVLMDVDFTSYVNNDTLDRANQMVQFLTTDEDDEFYEALKTGKLDQYYKKVRRSKGSQEAFYGKGAVGALGLVPVSDLIEFHNLGVAAGYWNMLADENSTVGWLAGLREYKKIDDLEFAKETAGMLSIEMERLFRRTGPAFGHANPISAVPRAELGLYPGTTTLGVKTRHMRKKFMKPKPTTKKKQKAGRSYVDIISEPLSRKQREGALRSLRGLDRL